jgi:hypothetical protein
MRRRAKPPRGRQNKDAATTPRAPRSPARPAGPRLRIWLCASYNGDVRRTGRFLIKVTTHLSCLCALLALTLWVRSYFALDRLCDPIRNLRAVLVSKGEVLICFSRWDDGLETGSVDATYTTEEPDDLADLLPPRYGASRGPFLGFGRGWGTSHVVRLEGGHAVRHQTVQTSYLVPLWSVVACCVGPLVLRSAFYLRHLRGR